MCFFRPQGETGVIFNLRREFDTGSASGLLTSQAEISLFFGQKRKLLTILKQLLFISLLITKLDFNFHNLTSVTKLLSSYLLRDVT